MSKTNQETVFSVILHSYHVNPNSGMSKWFSGECTKLTYCKLQYYILYAIWGRLGVLVQDRSTVTVNQDLSEALKPWVCPLFSISAQPCPAMVLYWGIRFWLCRPCGVAVMSSSWEKCIRNRLLCNNWW